MLDVEMDELNIEKNDRQCVVRNLGFVLVGREFPDTRTEVMTALEQATNLLESQKRLHEDHA